jgi:signal transduction histidine kinase
MEQNNDPKIETGYGIAKGSSSFETGQNAAKMALKAIHKYRISAVMVYASVKYDLPQVLKGISLIVGDAPIVGSTTAGEICNGVQEETVLVVILASPFLKVHCGLGTEVSKNWRTSLNKAITSPSIRPFFEDISEFSQKIKLQGKNIFIMLFSPGITNSTTSHSCEILEALKIECLGLYPIIGGSSADDWQMERSYVFHGTEVYRDSTLVLVFETELQFGISLTHGFHPTDLKATVTAVDGYEVLTLDGLPAGERLAKLLDISNEDFHEKNKSPEKSILLGLSDPMGQYSINVAHYSTPRGGIELTNRVYPGTILTIMEPDSMTTVNAGTEALRKAIIRGGITDVAISFTSYCALRTKIIGNMYEEEISRMTKMLTDKPLVGFVSFGEQGVADDGVSRFNNSAIACLVIGNELTQMAQVALENKRLLEEAMEYDKLKSEFITNISHELRTPVNVIMGALQLIELKDSTFKTPASNENADKYFKIMKQNCYRLVRLTNNLIDITKIEAGFSEIELRNHNIVQVIEDITLSVAEYVKSRDLELQFDTDIEEKIMAVDADKLERVMLNLLSNAVKFCKAGDKIYVNLQNGNENVKIIVKDTGIGIPEDKQHIIFERFRQVDSSLSRHHEGSGIGLSLVKRLVELHEGKISVRSSPGEGTEFSIELPVKKIHEEVFLPPTPNASQEGVQKMIMEFSDIYSI